MLAPSYRADGPEALRPVGETEFVGGFAEAMSASGSYGPTRLRRHRRAREPASGRAVQEVLEAHIEAGGGRFRGVRLNCAGDPDTGLTRPDIAAPPDLFADAAFRQGFARLAPLGLSFDAWLYHPQYRRPGRSRPGSPDTTIVLDHIGAPLGVGAYAGRREEVFARLGRRHPAAGRAART